MYDLIVAGAGPAGSTAARVATEAGARVLLLDRAAFPRDKPCGGGVNVRAAALLPFDLSPVVERTVTGVRFSLRLRGDFTRRYDGPLTYMTQRSRLDAFLVNRAVAAGANLHERDALRAIETGPDGVTVRTARSSYRGRVLIGADGANGVVARASGLDGPRDLAVAFEGNVPFPDGLPTRWRETAALDLGGIPGGYGWLFPKGDHVNVGVGGWLHQGPLLRKHLSRLCREHGIPEDALTEVRGYRLPLRRPGFTPALGRTALVGDAAGLIDPVSGDGIYEALLSSQLAVENALDIIAGRTADFSSYAGRLRRALALSAAASWRAKLALERFPNLSFSLLQAPYAWRALEQILRADVTHPGAIRGPGGAALRAAEWLARLSGDPGRAFA